MKEKRERNKKASLKNLAIIGTLIVVIAMIILPIIGPTIWYKNTLENYQQELESYSSDTYEYLAKSVSEIFKEGEDSIDINAKPNDIIIQKIEMGDDGKIVCELYLKGEVKKYFPTPNIIAQLSSDFRIESTSSPYSSEEEFLTALKTNIQNDAIITGCAIYIIMINALFLVMFVYSFKRKYKRTVQQQK